MTIGFSACKAELAALLADVKQQVAAAANLPALQRANAVKAQAARLQQFTAHSQPQDPLDEAEVDAIGELNRLAIDAAVTIQTAQVAVAVARIAARSTELAAIGAELSQHALDNLSDAKRLRLAPIHDTIAQLTEVVDTAKTLAGQLEQNNPDEAEIATAVGDLAAQLETLREALGTAIDAGG
jgi:hypothetical protein